MDQLIQSPAILVVDDDATTLKMLKYYMLKLAPNYEILTAEDASSALRQLAHRSIPLLITDYMMPGMDGLQLTAAVKAAAPQTYVILISANDSTELAQQARDQQVDTFIPKQNFLGRLGEVVRSVLLPAVA